MTVAIYPGSFDPITLGHIDILNRASHLFDTIIMAVVTNPNKSALIPPEDRVQLIHDCVGHLPNVQVECFDGLTVQFARQKAANVIIRGLRAVSDFENEFMMSQMNKLLEPEIETVFIMAGQEYQFLSSSLVKEVSGYGGDITKVVPPVVGQYLDRIKSHQA